MNDQDLVNSGTKHSSGVSIESPRPAQSEGLAGRELDAAIAERVMNIACSMERTPDHSKWCSRHGTGERVGAPFYSRDIDRAMEVVEKMREWGYFPCLWAAQLWNVEFWDEDHQFAGSCSEDSLPEAICRAALNTINEPARDAGTTTSR